MYLYGVSRGLDLAALDGTAAIRLRLLVASVDRAKEMGIDWWEHDPSLSSRAAELGRRRPWRRARGRAFQQIGEVGGLTSGTPVMRHPSPDRSAPITPSASR